jgi:hypothetical protein
MAPGALTAAAAPPAGPGARGGAKRYEVDLTQDDGGHFKATAVAYPDVTATGRTEKEALGLLIEALTRYMKRQGKGEPAPRG